MPDLPLKLLSLLTRDYDDANAKQTKIRIITLISAVPPDSIDTIKTRIWHKEKTQKCTYESQSSPGHW